MAGHEKEQGAVRRPAWNRIRKKATFSCLGGGILGLLIHFLVLGYVDRLPKGSVLHQVMDIAGEAALHIGIAFLVALILVWVLEAEAKRASDEELQFFIGTVSRDVFQAVLSSIVPPQIMEEFTNILRLEVTRKACEYTITLKEPENGSSDSVIIHRELSFIVSNITNRQVIFPVRSMHEAEEGADATSPIPHHLDLRIDGKEIPLIEGTNIFKEDDHQTRHRYTKLEHLIPLSPGEERRVYISGAEKVAISGGFSMFTQMTPALSMEVVVKNDYPERIQDPKVLMHHPQWRDMQQYAPNRYSLNKAFLPGQGFQVHWRS